LAENYKMMSGLGFLKPEIAVSDVSKILKIPQTGARPGRPISIPITYEDMMNIKNWDSSKLIFKKSVADEAETMTGFGQGQ
jgi:hypothetical protein